MTITACSALQASEYSNTLWLSALKLNFSGQRRYHIYSSFYYVRSPDICKLTDALQILVNNNYNLRSVFIERNNQLEQIIQSKVDVKLDIYNAISDLDAKCKIEEIIQKPFNLAAGPLFNFSFIKLKHGKGGYFLPNFHHIIIDGTQFDLLMSELSGYYHQKNHLATKSNDIAKLQQYLAWEKTQIAKSSLSDNHYKELKTASGATKQFISTIRPKDHPSGKVTQAYFELDKELDNDLSHLATRLFCSKFDILKLAWGALICKYFDLSDVIVSFPFNTRRGKFKEVKGAFLNQSLFAISMQKSMPELLKTEQANKRNWRQYYYNIVKLMADLELQSLPFAISPTSLLNNGPIFEVKPQSQFSTELGSADLCLFFNDDDDLKYGIVAERNLLSPEQLNKLNELFTAITKQMSLQPELSMQEITSLAMKHISAKPNHIASEWQDKLSKKNIVDLFEDNALLFSNSPCLISDESSLSYGEVNIKANKLARFIISQYKKVIGHEINAKTILPVMVQKSQNYVITILAILKTGAAYCPIDSKNNSNRTQAILEDIGCNIIVTDDALNVDMPKNYKLISLHDSAIKFEQDTNLNKPISTNNAAYVMYSSGTTGKPKGIISKHLNVVSLVQGAGYFEATSKDSFALFADPAFDATTFELFGALLNGAKLYTPNNRLEILLDASLFKHYLERCGITILWLTKTIFDSLFSQDSTIFRALNYLIVGGETLNLNNIQQLYNSPNRPKRILNGYGPTENTTFSFTYEVGDDINGLSSVPIGQPLANRYGYVLDDDLNILPSGAVGVLYLGGAGLASGYLNNQSLTDEYFIDNPHAENAGDKIYNSQDLVRQLPCGNLAYFGRKDAQAKLKGYRIELSEIGQKLQQYSTIKQAAACIKIIAGQQYLVGYYVAAEEISPGKLRGYMANHLPTYMVPHIFCKIEYIPFNQNGKIDLLALPTSSLQVNNDKIVQNKYSQGSMLHNIWSELLQNDEFSKDATFFELGGDSLKIVELKRRIKDKLNIEINIVDLFEHSTFRQLDRYIANLTQQDAILSKKQTLQISTQQQNDDIAIIGMACRLPNNIEAINEYWHLLKEGQTTIRDLTAAERQSAGEIAAHKDFVGRAAILDSHYDFDARFFGYTDHDAVLLDPQQRHFLELSWQALEDSNNLPDDFAGDIGVFAAQGKNYYYSNKISSSSNSNTPTEKYQSMIANEKDFLATRIAYKLNLTGPATTIQTGCSSSLVGVNNAINSLKLGECDMAIAGGISLFDRLGYKYQQDMIESPDGYCRPFDVNAAGTIGASGAGIVVLKRLKDAIDSGDHIYAIIKGGAINNDGSEKISYTSPSGKGQAKVIEKALQKANLRPSDIDYIEAHGTATEIGDPIELAALHQVYSADDNSQKFGQAVGSVKGNIGHTDTAAGVLGLIKAALVLRNKYIPQSLYFTDFNPEIKAFNECFYVPTCGEVLASKGTPKRAAVSSFGIGGTNAHVILEEYNKQNSTYLNLTNEYFALPISANSYNSLLAISNKWSSFLQDAPSNQIQDIVETAIKHRRFFSMRGYIILHKNPSLQASKLKIIDTKYNSTPTNDTKELAFIFTKAAGQSTIDKQINYLKQLIAASVNTPTIYADESIREELSSIYDITSSKITFLADITDVTILLPGANYCSVMHIAELASQTTNYSYIIKGQDVSLDWLNFTAELWLNGSAINWQNINQLPQETKKIPIPTYCFDRQEYIYQANLADEADSANLSRSDKLKLLWVEALGIDHKDIHENSNFFELGGESIALLNLINKLKNSFAVEFSLQEIIQYLVFREMLQALEEQLSEVQNV